jgi:hypothetical protein
MAVGYLVILYFFLIILQILHVFEEIAMKAYEVMPKGSLNKYLFISSGILSVYMTAFLGIALDMMFGYILVLIGCGLAILNGVVHTIRYLKNRKKKELSGTIAAGFYSGIPLSLYGVVVLIFFIIFLARL